MTRRWHVVQVNPGKEAKVAQAIVEIPDLGFGSFLPLMEKEISHARRKSIVRRPLYPNYIFAEFDPEEDDWVPILRVRGVHTMLGIHKTSGIPTSQAQIAQRYRPRPPLALRQDVVPALRAAMDAGDGIIRVEPEEIEQLRPLIEGERVRITSGPLTGLDGLVAFDRRKRVGVMLDMLGKNDAISIPRESIALAG